jgi:3-deoxy-manno-octulosonate cytidylyltransferase (CMP-KDO synthetase)
MRFTVVIPARYASTRFPGKPLADINGKSMIQHVYERAIDSGANQVIVATDDSRIADVVTQFGGCYCMTSSEHESGTERIAEVIKLNRLSDDEVIVNVQGDEPFIPESNIQQVAKNLVEYKVASMATLAVKIEDVEEVFNPNAVKVVVDQKGYALYFSRSVLPYDRERFLGKDKVSDVGDFYLRHVGLYAYRAKFVNDYVAMETSSLEQIESLEQLRVLWHGRKIHVDVALETPPAGIDTPEDLQRLIDPST